MPFSYHEPVGIIDVHHHWINEPDYLDHLLREMDRLDVERAGLMAMGKLFQRLFLTQSEPSGCVDNDDLARVIAKRSDRFFGYGYFRIGEDPPERIDRFAEQGFAGVKFHVPAWDYDDERCFPIYERAARLDRVCLFHTGPFMLPESLAGRRASSARCRPIMLEPIANEFPHLKIIIAHLGVCWGEEAATLCRIHPNIYADLSGNLNGWRISKPISWWQEMLFWPEASRKILFGSDLHYRDMEAAIRQQCDIFERMGWSKRRIQQVLHDNASELFSF